MEDFNCVGLCVLDKIFFFPILRLE